MQQDFTHAYCDNCKKITKCRVDDMFYEDISGKYIGGDIYCAECAYILATVYRSNDA